jgi:cytochrome c2
MLQFSRVDVLNFTIKMRTFITLIAVLFFISCQTSEKPKYSNVYKGLTSQKTNQLEEHPGKKLMEINCYVCHSPTLGHENRIAPPMIAIKKHYISSKTTKEKFKTALQSWIENPTKENSKMAGAVKRFGVMPKTPFPKKNNRFNCGLYV